MAGRVTSCPNCGGQVEFKAGASLLAVCGYCESAVARVGDDVGKLEILGKVAPLAALVTPLSIGVRGKHEGKRFELVGRAQLDYGLGPWNEWYAAFDDGRWGWLAEAQGKVYLTFGRPPGDLPSFSHWRVGTKLDFEGQPLVVTERRRAQFVGAEGELPFAIAPGAHVFYCDVEGPGGVFGTLDFGESTNLETVFLGTELTYGELFGKDVLGHVEPQEAGASVGLSCPNCDEPVALLAPSQAQRVTCSACDSLLDCGEGNQLFLLSSLERKGPAPEIPLGSVGKRDGVKWTVLGHLYRTVSFDYESFGWQEYLLHNSDKGYRWMSNSDGHWSWIEPVSAGAVQLSGLSATYRDKAYKHFSGAAATVESLRGEFYWKVAIGDRTGVTDWVSPPYVLSRERTDEEVTWSHGLYLTPDIVAEMFGRKEPLPKPMGVAPNMPNHFAATRNRMLVAALVFSVLLAVLGAVVAGGSSGTMLVESSAPIDRTANATDPKHVFLSEPFTVDSQSNMAVEIAADVDNAWLFVSGALINEEANEVRQFGVDVSYYAGYSGGESWREGSKSRTIYLGSVIPGTYVLRLQPQWDAKLKSPTVWWARVRTDVFIASHLAFFFFALWILPLIAVVRYASIEKQRWADSDH